MARLFISYDRASKGDVKELVRDLNDLHSTWFDQQLTGGQDWWDTILLEIRRCDIFVAALTPDFVESQACQRELTYANLLQKQMLPVRLSEKVQPEALPSVLAKRQLVDYCRRDEQAFKQLVLALGELPEAPPLPDPLPDPPPVPMSYLSTLREQIEIDSELTPTDQFYLVFELRSHFRDGGRPEEIEEIIDLLQRLKRRRELLAKVARDIDELLGDLNRGQRGSFSSKEPIDSSGTPEESRKDQVRTAKSDNGTEPVTDIFISYSNSDRAHAKALTEALKQHGWSVWWDREIPIGRTWDEVIEEVISKARSILVLWSPSSVASDWVKNEARDGKTRHILFPALIEPTNLPFEFRHIQTADLTAWKLGEPNAGFNRLLAGLHGLLDLSETIPSSQWQRGPPSSKGHIVSNDTPEEVREVRVPEAGPDNNGATLSRTVTRELVMAVAAELGSMNPAWYAPDIPVDKANNARASMKIPAGESMLVLFDDTDFGSAKDGLVIGIKGLYYKALWKSPEYASWEAFLASPVEVEQYWLFTKLKVAGKSWLLTTAAESASTFLMKLRARALDGP